MAKEMVNWSEWDELRATQIDLHTSDLDVVACGVGSIVR
jgi:hypothetical protein